MGTFKDNEAAKAGLCASCRHMKINRSDRGAVFYYCRRSETDPTLPKYPAIPVLDCRGHETPAG